MKFSAILCSVPTCCTFRIDCHVFATIACKCLLRAFFPISYYYYRVQLQPTEVPSVVVQHHLLAASLANSETSVSGSGLSCCPMKWHLSRFITTTIWISSISLTLPWTPYFCLVQTGGEDLHISTDVWPTEEIETTYFIFVSQCQCS
ncbi:hypothetical protein AVEN_87719-1 [Araneus ventricosus]|uniref:Uncharacterized protein n=1 Tax=Araneus ventricosus TaxID=182803 RepID=A0A4Y2NY94_ARAVE|nr:hypothetical protein AVEN_87719-1 [Araneus ventricosus]